MQPMVYADMHLLRVLFLAIQGSNRWDDFGCVIAFGLNDFIKKEYGEAQTFRLNKYLCLRLQVLSIRT